MGFFNAEIDELLCTDSTPLQKNVSHAANIAAIFHRLLAMIVLSTCLTGHLASFLLQDFHWT